MIRAVCRPLAIQCADVGVRGEIAIDVDVLRGPGRGELDDLVLRDLIGAAVDVLPDGHVLSGQAHGCVVSTSEHVIGLWPPVPS